MKKFFVIMLLVNFTTLQASVMIRRSLNTAICIRYFTTTSSTTYAQRLQARVARLETVLQECNAAICNAQTLPTGTAAVFLALQEQRRDALEKELYKLREQLVNVGLSYLL